MRTILVKLSAVVLAVLGVMVFAGGCSGGGQKPPLRVENSAQRKVYWDSKLYQTITVEGLALNAQPNPLLRTAHGEIFMDGIQSWPKRFLAKDVRVTGIVIMKYDIVVSEAGADKKKGRKRYYLKDSKVVIPWRWSW